MNFEKERFEADQFILIPPLMLLNHGLDNHHTMLVPIIRDFTITTSPIPVATRAPFSHGMGGKWSIFRNRTV
jgi:hypothetical protein